MEREDQFTVRGRARSIGHAIHGIGLMLRKQHNARIHLAVTILALAAGALLRIRASEWLWIVVAIVAVWAAESLNTALELLADVSSPGFHPVVRQAKDIAAAAVLIVSLGSAVVGLLIFGPYLLGLFR